jgi:DNA-binding transcriptional MocR family regulator
MWNISLDKNLDTPLYVQVAKHIKELIDENKLEDDKLPSIRQLAKKLDVNNVTIVNAYKQLEQDGYVYSIKGSGTYIRRLPIPEDLSYLEEGDMELMVSGIMPISHDSINFASVSPTPDVFPIEDFKKSLSRVLDRDGAHAFLYPEITGFEPLRESISKFLLENSQIHVNKDQILITSGGQQALDIITKTLIDQGDSILVENPTYSGALSAFESRGARIIGVPMLEDGIDIDALKANIRRYRPKFLYMMTNFQNPTTYSYSEEKKSELLALAYEYEFYIIEDDFLTDLSFKERVDLPLKSRDKYDNVIYIKSFSKIFMPGVRIGFITLPNKLFKNIIKAKHTTDITSSGFLQRAFDEYLRMGYWKEHINRVREVYKEKYDFFIKELDRLREYGIDFIPPNGGMSFWVRLPEDIDGVELYKECIDYKLSIVPGKVFFTDSSLYSNYIRLSFGTVDKEEIRDGVRILENILTKPSLSKDSKYLPFV